MGSAVSSADQHGTAAAVDKVRSSSQSRSVSPVTRLEHKMTIACDIPTQMIVDDSSSSTEKSNPIQVKRAAFSFDLSPPSLSNCGLMARRRRSKELFQRFCSINEVEPADAFMRTIH